jgi:pimeloyl-ACP methyl ester carboxylesterase
MVQNIKHTEAAFAQANGLTICYDTFGDPAAAPLLLLDGYGCQMIEWYDDWCQELASRGYWVIRHDNRDIGLSTKLDTFGVPDFKGSGLTDTPTLPPPYTLADHADDSVGLMDALGIPRAHVVGISMGGFIAQWMAMRHPGRIASMTSIMSTDKNPAVPRPAHPVAPGMEARTGSREEFIETYARWERAIAGRFPRTVDELRAHAGELWDRGLSPEGKARQLVAMAGTPPWHEALRAVTAPTLIIHGDMDPLVSVEGGRDTAAHIPGAKLLIIEGWGHGYPARELWPTLIDAIAAHAR